jgi:hypothetical protein
MVVALAATAESNGLELSTKNSQPLKVGPEQNGRGKSVHEGVAAARREPMPTA